MIVGKIAFAAGALLGLSIGLSFVHPWGNARNAAPESEMLASATVPADVRVILGTKCADCHSNRTHWPVYSRLAPASWLMEHEVQKARNAMNLSCWSRMSADERIAALTRIAAEVRSGEMPPGLYALMHPAARLSAEQTQSLIAWARAERKNIRTMSEQPKGADTQ